MNIVFLDVDGVLNQKVPSEGDHGHLDDGCIASLHKILLLTNAKIVLSSGWRLWFNDQMRPQTATAALLSHHLAQFGMTLFDKTPDFSTDAIRHERTFSRIKAREIYAWLDAHPEAERFIVLDDLELHNEELRPYIIQTDGSQGLTYADAMNGIHLLLHGRFFGRFAPSE